MLVTPYHKAPGHTFLDNVQSVHPAVPGDKAYPGAELILTPPTAPEPVLIDNGMFKPLLCEYISYFPKEFPKGGSTGSEHAPLNTPQSTTVLSSIRLTGEKVFTTYTDGTTGERFVPI